MMKPRYFPEDFREAQTCSNAMAEQKMNAVDDERVLNILARTGATSEDDARGSRLAFPKAQFSKLLQEMTRMESLLRCSIPSPDCWFVFVAFTTNPRKSHLNGRTFKTPNMMM